MKLQIFSDLHIDVMPTRPVAISPEADVVVVAGDVCEGIENAFASLRAMVPRAVPIVFVAGNHEFYRRTLMDELEIGHRLALRHGVHLLDDREVIIDGVKFVGCTLWTDYRLFGADMQPVAMARARDRLNDHRRIAWSKLPWKRFRPQEALELHRQARMFLEDTMSNPFGGATVVVTHHAPHPGSLEERFRSDLISAAFVSDLAETIEVCRPALWVHGHTHGSFDYCVGVTRIICNAHGYGDENKAFDPSLVVEIASEEAGGRS
jgi:Icc-related predicted phosphoesterase